MLACHLQTYSGCAIGNHLWQLVPPLHLTHTHSLLAYTSTSTSIWQAVPSFPSHTITAHPLCQSSSVGGALRKHGCDRLTEVTVKIWVKLLFVGVISKHILYEKRFLFVLKVL